MPVARLLIKPLLLAAATMAALPAVIQAETDAAVAEHMHQHLSAMRAMRAFIIAGQLDGMREPAVWLQEHQATPGLPEGWQPYVAQLRRYAGEAAEARHLVYGAASISEMARVCGDCHQANGVQVDVGGSLTPPDDGTSVNAQMLRHLWAVNRMWQGLIAPSDEAWTRGAQALAGVQLSAADITMMPAAQPKAEFLLIRAREIGVEAQRAADREARSVLYGELLSLCADCHNLTGGGPAR